MRNRMIAVAGILLMSASVLAGCSKTEPVVETSETLSEVVSEAVSEIESNEPSEEVSEVSIECPQKIELNLSDGEEYIVQEKLDSDTVYKRIEEIEKLAKEKYGDQKDFQFERDCMIAVYLFTNMDYMDDETVDSIVSDYLAKWSSDDLTGCYTYAFGDDYDYLAGDESIYLHDPVYKNQMDIFNYYFTLYVNEEEGETRRDYFDILFSAVNGNEYGIFPMTFDSNSKGVNYPIYRLMCKKIMGYTGSLIGDKYRNDYEPFCEFYYTDDEIADVNYNYLGLIEKAQVIAKSEDTRIMNPDSYISSHRKKSN